MPLAGYILVSIETISFKLSLVIGIVVAILLLIIFRLGKKMNLSAFRP